MTPGPARLPTDTLAARRGATAAHLSEQLVPLTRDGHHAKAQAVARRIVRRLRTGRVTSTDTIDQLRRTADATAALGGHAAAETLLLHALRLTRTAKGAGHPHTGDILQSLGDLYDATSRLAKAQSAYRRAIAIWRGTPMASRPRFANCLNSLGLSLRSSRRYPQAERALTEALASARRILGDADSNVATVRHNLASVYRTMGRFTEATVLLRDALVTRRKALGEGDRSVASTVDLLGDVLRQAGNLREAMPYLEQAVELRRMHGDADPDYAESLCSLAELCTDTGEHGKAEQLLDEALRIQRAAFGDLHERVALTLYSSGVLYVEMGKYFVAAPLFQRAEAIYLKLKGPRDPAVGSCKSSLAVTLKWLGNYTEPEKLLLDALRISRRLGRRNPGVASDLNNLGELYRVRGEYGRAARRFRQAIRAFQDTHGTLHPDVATAMYNLARLYVSMNRHREAYALMRQACRIDDELIAQFFSAGSEDQRRRFLLTQRYRVDVFLSLIVERMLTSPAARCAMLDLVLRRKAIGAELLSAQQETVVARRPAAVVAKMKELADVRAELARQTVDRPASRGSGPHGVRLGELIRRRDRLEAAIARALPEIGLRQRLRRADRRAIAAALPEGAALVELVQFTPYDFSSISRFDRHGWKPARYFALVLRAGRPNAPAVLDLGEAEPVDRLVSSFVAAIAGTSSDDVWHRGSALRAAVFDPLKVTLAHGTHLLFAADGDVSCLPLGALPLSRNRHVIDEFRISYLSVGRDVLRIGARVRGSGPALVAADPDFDLGIRHRVRQHITPNPPVAGRQSRDMLREGYHFSRLPGTRAEGREIGALLGVKPLMGRDVVESRVRQCASPCVLHIATHGFFLPNQPEAAEPTDPSHPRSARLENIEAAENPLLRSGLALAGANTWLQGKALPPNAEDGILNGEDVALLDVGATELVVLSACETGLGDVHVGEGVFGLRRAFALAGARTLIMSLWRVPDRETRMLMTHFYRGVLAGRPRADALRDAQLALKRTHAHPRYWGAFICQGDPGPISAKLRRGRSRQRARGAIGSRAESR